MASKASTLGDPRRPQEIRKISKTKMTPDDQPSPFVLMGVVFSMGSMLLRVKLLAWVALFTGLVTFAHLKTGSQDGKQIMMMTVTAFASLFSNYFGPAPLVRQQATSPPPAAHPVLEQLAT